MTRKGDDDDRDGPAMTGMGGEETKRACTLCKPFFILSARELFLASLVPLIELVNAAGGVDDLGLAGVEGMRSVGNLNLHEGVLNAFDLDRLLGVDARTGDEYIIV